MRQTGLRSVGELTHVAEEDVEASRRASRAAHRQKHAEPRGHLASHGVRGVGRAPPGENAEADEERDRVDDESEERHQPRSADERDPGARLRGEDVGREA